MLLAFGELPGVRTGGEVASDGGEEAKPAPTAEAQDAPKIPNDQLESLVAPIATNRIRC